MILDKADEMIKMHAGLGGGYNRNTARIILGEVMRDFGQEEVDKLIIKYNLSTLWGFKIGELFKTPWSQ